MNTLTSRFFAIMVVLLLGMTSPVSAQEKLASLFSVQSDPFQAAHAECEAVDFWGCASVQASGVSLKRFIKALRLTQHLVLEANGWNEDMLNEIVPANVFFKVIRS
jgi:hypothetical protein